MMHALVHYALYTDAFQILFNTIALSTKYTNRQHLSTADVLILYLLLKYSIFSII